MVLDSFVKPFSDQVSIWLFSVDAALQLPSASKLATTLFDDTNGVARLVAVGDHTTIHIFRRDGSLAARHLSEGTAPVTALGAFQTRRNVTVLVSGRLT